MYLAGVDVGGTFTDVVLFKEDTGELEVSKVPSTPRDQSIGLIKALESVNAEFASLGMIVHGTTVATNAILERSGAKCALITTKGFKDIIELRRRDRPRLYGLSGTFEPLIPRDLRFEIDERTNFEGQILKEVNAAEVKAIAKKLIKEKVEKVVISLIHSYANPTNELKVLEVLKGETLDGLVMLSSDILPEMGELERSSTVVVNAYIQPQMSKYLSLLLERLKSKGYKNDILVVQSNGGIMSSKFSEKFSVNTILSGPSAGVVAASYISSLAGFKNIISCDMGGTSFDVSLISDATPSMRTETTIDFGLPIKVPTVDIHTIGAGGGSIAWVDRGGFLQVGPESAGADPGPACYGKGGENPTVTDANLILGRINPEYPISKEENFYLNRSLGEKVIQEKIGKPLGLSLEEAAFAIIEIINNKMAGRIRMISVEKGYDPRDFILFAFGGAGPLHAASLLKLVGIGKVVVPYLPGITSALGCILCDFRHDFVQTINKRIDVVNFDEIESVRSNQFNKGREILLQEGFRSNKNIRTVYQADMGYEGQIHTIRVGLPSESIDQNKIRDLFSRQYESEYGQILEGIPICIKNIRTSIIGIRDTLNLNKIVSKANVKLENAVKEKRKVYFDKKGRECQIFERNLIPIETEIKGPAVIEQPDTTVIIDPDMKARVDNYGNIIMEVS